MGASTATTSNTAGSNDNKQSHTKRQSNLQKNIDKLVLKGATDEAIAGLKAKKEKEAKQFYYNTQGTQDIANEVKNRLGLTTLPNTPPPGQKWSGFDSPTSQVALSLQGKDRWMYGQEASKFTNEALEKRGLAKVSSYFQQVGGETIRISKEQYASLEKKGAKGLHKSYNIKPGARNIKYGNKNQAMGSGDSSGVLTSIPISHKMLQSQNKLKGLAVGALSLAVPGIGGTVMRLDAAKSLKDAATPGKAYKEYTEQFDAKMNKRKPPKKSTLLSDIVEGGKSLKLSLGGE